MSIDFLISQSGTYTSIKDYLVSCDKVPYFTRNRDLTPSNETVKCSISATCTITPAKGDKFKLVIDGVTVFGGYAGSVLNNYDTRTFDVELLNDLMKLSEHLVEYTELHDDIYTNSGGDWMKYTAYVNATYGAPNDQYPTGTVGILYLMQRMFAISGLTLDTSALDSEAILTGYTYGNGGGYEVPTTGDVLYKHLFIYEEQLYCINQNVATYHTSLDANTGAPGSDGYQGNKITFLDYVREICSNLSLCLKITSANNYALVHPTTNYTVADDDKYFYSQASTEAKEANVSMIRLYGSVQLFQRDAVTDLNTIGAAWDGKGSTTVKIYNNHAIYFYEYYDGAYRPYAPNALACYVVTGGSWDNGDGNVNILQNKVDELTKAYSQETITTDITTTFKTVRSHLIDIENRVSEIIQETV